MDVVAGALILLWFISDYYAISISFPVYFALGSAVWLIYTTDHLMDVRRVDFPSSNRHQFHKNHFDRILIVGVFILLIALGNLFFLPVLILLGGVVLGAVCLLYLFLCQHLAIKGLKEIFIAFLFATGIFIAPFTQLEHLGLVDFIFWFQLTLLALVNLLLIAQFEVENDARDNFASAVLIWGEERTRHLVHILIVLSLIISILMINRSDLGFQAFFIAANSLFLFVDWYPRYFVKNRSYQLLVDGVFLLPLLLI